MNEKEVSVVIKRNGRERFSTLKLTGRWAATGIVREDVDESSKRQLFQEREEALRRRLQKLAK